MCVFLSVTVVETFLNAFFRIVVTEDGYTQHAKTILDGLSGQSRYADLETKIKEWPKCIFGKSLNLASGAGQHFVTLKNTRNDLMHFTSSHDTIKVSDGVYLSGMADTGIFDSLDANMAIEALKTAQGFISEVLLTKGVKPEDIPKNIHFWTGMPPID